MEALLRRAQRKIKRMGMNFSPVARHIFMAALFFHCSLLAAQVPPLTFVEDSLPTLDAGIEFHILLHASGGAPPYVFSLASGDLPDGISLSPDGLLSGRPSKPGIFTFVLRVEDSARPPRSFTKDFHTEVTAPLLLEWLDPPKAHEDRIDGSVQVSNGSKNTIDLTVVIVAVAENGRATAIGYQHFPLQAGALNVKIPFGNSLPHGGYVIHADAIAEIAARNIILRQRLQTPQPLQVIQGP